MLSYPGQPNCVTLEITYQLLCVMTSKWFKSTQSCFIFSLTQPQVANQQQKNVSTFLAPNYQHQTLHWLKVWETIQYAPLSLKNETLFKLGKRLNCCSFCTILCSAACTKSITNLVLMAFKLSSVYRQQMRLWSLNLFPHCNGYGSLETAEKIFC